MHYLFFRDDFKLPAANFCFCNLRLLDARKGDLPCAITAWNYLNCAWSIGIEWIFDWGGGPNPKSHAMTSSKTSKEEFFVGVKIS